MTNYVKGFKCIRGFILKNTLVQSGYPLCSVVSFTAAGAAASTLASKGWQERRGGQRYVRGNMLIVAANACHCIIINYLMLAYWTVVHKVKDFRHSSDSSPS